MSSPTRGKDPAELAKRARAAEEAKQTQTFGAAMEKFIAKKVNKQRKAVAVEREIRKELMPRFAKLPAGAVTRKMVSQMVDQIAARSVPSPPRARSLPSFLLLVPADGVERRFRHPGQSVRPADSKDMIEGIKARERVLNDEEIRAVWKAAERMGYPMGRVNQLLLLTGCRKAEVAGARWAEFDLAGGIWTIPSERFKSDRAHLVPLSADALELLEQLPAGAPAIICSAPPTAGRRSTASPSPRSSSMHWSSRSSAMSPPLGDARSQTHGQDQALTAQSPLRGSRA